MSSTKEKGLTLVLCEGLHLKSQEVVSLLKTGEFSVLSQISIHMLRHYNDIGLLIPEHVDDFTGYKYYSERQLPIANRIQALKSMG